MFIYFFFLTKLFPILISGQYSLFICLSKSIIPDISLVLKIHLNLPVFLSMATPAGDREIITIFLLQTIANCDLLNVSKKSFVVTIRKKISEVSTHYGHITGCPMKKHPNLINLERSHPFLFCL